MHCVYFLLFIILVIPILGQETQSETFEKLNGTNATSTANSTDDVDKEIQFEEAQTNKTSDDEIMETADMMVFRPLFAYRQQQSRRQRIYASRRNWQN
ncbi:hypothetical protein Zmor_021038 [Zophobas morio]|uniref:Uncharacterized protein n=1 Tax=Zophobas morio TaxID=2755281 RepID=A0AA38I6U1_9CUCU|nr:hypothetical protein Zmor_021038 [Zophobas morio]